MLNSKRLYNIAIYYLKRYDSSSFNLRKVLKRRVVRERAKNAEIPDDIDSVIENVIARVKEMGYVDDVRFMENEIRRLTARGKSRSFIERKLVSCGYKKSDFAAYLDENAADETETVSAMIKKRKLFTDPARRQKDLAKLLRAGFKYAAIVNALKKNDYSSDDLLPDNAIPFDE